MNNWHLSSAYLQPGIVQNVFNILSNLIPASVLTYCFPPLYDETEIQKS